MDYNERKKRSRYDYDKPIVDVWRREAGFISSRNFAHRVAASQEFVLRLDFSRKLEKHRGCVNTVSFNESGDILVSGSDDRKVVLWDWEIGSVKLSFHSGHSGNVFQARIMPYSNDCSIVTCAADGQVRHADLFNCGRAETTCLGSHDERAHKLAVEPGSPHRFYTCGEDGVVQHFDLRTKAATVLFSCHSRAHKGRGIHWPINGLTAIAIDPRDPNLFAVGGSDKYARLYDIRKYNWDGSNDFDHPVNYFCPQHLLHNERVGITGLAFSDLSELLVSYCNENIYLFAKDMGLGPNLDPSSPISIDSDSDFDNAADKSPYGTFNATMQTNEELTPRIYKGHRNFETVKGVNFFGPSCEYVVSGSDCGRIFIWRKKDCELIRVMEADKYVVNCIEPHPHITMLASSGFEKNIKIWIPKAEERASFPPKIQEVCTRRRMYIFGFDDDDEEDFSYDENGDTSDDNTDDMDSDDDDDDDDSDDDDDDSDDDDEVEDAETNL